MRKFDQTIIQQARQSDLHAYLTSRGEQFKKVGKEYQHSEHHSLYVKGNMFHWYARQLSGNSLNFVMNYYSMSFVDAVRELVEKSQIQVAHSALSIEKPEKYELKITKAYNVKRVIAYLSKTRKIDYEVIQMCLDRHILSQDIQGNVVFKWLNESQQVVGAELCGTNTAVRYKGVAAGSKAGHGFTVLLGTAPSKICFFESSIDLLSYICLFKNKLTSHVLISMSGLKDVIVANSIKRFDMRNVYMCVDRDDAGINFAQKMKKIYGAKMHFPLNGYKDWNELQQSR